MEERLEALHEPWTSFLVEFPTYPKQLILGREESQRVLFLCPQSEANPTELCLALFGSQILMHRLHPGESNEVQATVSFLFVYSAETPDALRSILDRYQTVATVPVLVAQKSNVVKTAHFVTEFLNRVTSPTMSQGRAWSDVGEGAGLNGMAKLDVEVTSLPDDSELWNKNLPDIMMAGDEGAVHAAQQLHDYRAEYACRFVLAHYNENINRDKMAEMVNLSPGYFSNLFRSEVGMSFSDYLIQVRIENAKGLLRRFDLSVEAISKKCGFNSLAHFSRTFKDRCGLSPLKFRKSPNTVN